LYSENYHLIAAVLHQMDGIAETSNAWSSNPVTLNQRWHGPLMVRFWGGPPRLNEWAANDIFSGSISPGRCRPLTLKNVQSFWVKRTTRWQWKWVKLPGIVPPMLLFRHVCSSHMWA